MAKPRRKHIGISTIEQSPQGNHFLALWRAVLRTDSFVYAPIESLKDGTHIFVVRGDAGWGVMVERKEKACGSEWLNRCAILFEPGWSPVIWQMELVTHRWDPWLHTKKTGDATVRDSPPAERRRVTDALRAEGGSRKDRLIVRVLPFDAPLPRVAGIPRQTIDRVLVKHGFRERDFSDLGSGPRRGGE